MKKSAALLLALVLMLSLFACGGDVPSPSDDGDTTAADTTAQSTDTASPEVDTSGDAGADEPSETGHFIYDHVVVVGVDGAGHFFNEVDTPNFDRIFENGSVTYSAYSVYPTMSAENWASMLTGVGPALHGRTNSTVAEVAYPLDSQYPTLFRRLRNEFPDVWLSSYCNWSKITTGIAESDTDLCSRTADTDEELTTLICSHIKKLKPKFLFVQFDSVDETGHETGYGSAEYRERIGVVDGLMGQIYDALGEAGIAESTLFIVIADHGGTYSGEGVHSDHGGWTDAEKYVTFAVAGKNVKAGEMGHANVRDLASVVLYAFGMEAPKFDINGWTSQIPDGIFDEKDIPEYNNFYTDDGREP